MRETKEIDRNFSLKINDTETEMQQQNIVKFMIIILPPLTSNGTPKTKSEQTYCTQQKYSGSSHLR